MCPQPPHPWCPRCQATRPPAASRDPCGQWTCGTQPSWHWWDTARPGCQVDHAAAARCLLCWCLALRAWHARALGAYCRNDSRAQLAVLLSQHVWLPTCAAWPTPLLNPCSTAQVVIEAGANGISNAAISVSGSPAAPGAPSAGPDTTSVVCAANITVLQPGTPISTTTLGCAAMGRYVTLAADQPMDLCRCAGGRGWLSKPANAQRVSAHAMVCRGVDLQAAGTRQHGALGQPGPCESCCPLVFAAACLFTRPQPMRLGTSPTAPPVTLGMQ